MRRLGVMAKTAAFFDLDKTLLSKSSTLAYVKPLFEGGLLTRNSMIRGAYSQFVYQLGGADHDQMEQARVQLSEMVEGWDVAQIEEIVNQALNDVIEPIVYTEGLKLIEEHHAAGRDVVIISSSGTEVVEPIAARLGADIAVGTQMAIEDGKYTGEILFYAYGEGKVDAIKRLAEERGYDLAESYAYSDSITDLPMLEAVGHPVATNPDKALREVARDNVWPVMEFRKPEKAEKADKSESEEDHAHDTQKKIAVGAVAAGAAGAVALGVAWYARNRNRT